MYPPPLTTTIRLPLGYNLNLIFVLTFFDLNFLTATTAKITSARLNVKKSIFGTFALAFTHIPHLDAKCHQDLTRSGIFDVGELRQTKLRFVLRARKRASKL